MIFPAFFLDFYSNFPARCRQPRYLSTAFRHNDSPQPLHRYMHASGWFPAFRRLRYRKNHHYQAYKSPVTFLRRDDYRTSAGNLYPGNQPLFTRPFWLLA